MNLEYLIPRVVRHFMPERITRFLLLRSLVIRPGLETSDPMSAARRYVQTLTDRGRSLSGSRILVFGYGGRFDIAIQLLEAGAGHVLLYDRFAPPDDKHNRVLAAQYPAFMRADGSQAAPNPEKITIVRADIGRAEASPELTPVDYVVSTSVYEHLADVPANTRALAALTRPEGLHIHFIDLRDHFFKYPFEMLHYSDSTWESWLNPTSHHNRYRLWDYRSAFEACFGKVEVEILARDDAGFAKVQERIRPEFKRGDSEENSVTLIRVIAERPRLSN